MILNYPGMPGKLHGTGEADKESRRIRDTAEEKAGEMAQKWRSQRSKALEGLNPPLLTLKTKRPGVKECRRPLQVEYEPQPQLTKEQGPQFHHGTERNSANKPVQKLCPLEPPERNTTLPATSYEP